MPTLDEIKHRTTPVGKILGVIEYLEGQGDGGEGGTVAWDDVTDKPVTFPASPDSVETAVADKAEIAALEPIADPSTADAEAVAAAYNALLAALKA